MRERVRVLLMGCICSKRAIHLRRGQRRGAGGRASGIHHRQISKSNNEHASRRNTSGGDPVNGNGGASDGRAESELTIDGSNSPNITSDSSGLYEAMFAGLQIAPAIPNALETEQIAAGWPSWLTSVASEAIRGMLPRKGTEFEILEKVGRGTYSTVIKAREKATNEMMVLKRVKFVNRDRESVRFMSREIEILRRLDHPNIIQLKGIIATNTSENLYLVFEHMEHDLAGLSSIPGNKYTETQVKCFMKQLFSGLEHCHGRGILHRDVKSSNLLVNDNGILKLADFGLAAHFDLNRTQSLTARVVTLWYRPPELLLGATEYDDSIDLWSTGCLLGEMFAGRPLMAGSTEVEQMHRIFKLCGSPSSEYWKMSKLPHTTIFKPRNHYKRCIRKTYKEFSSSTLDLLDVLLAIKPEERGTASSALASNFFTTKPFACDPSDLPKHPPNKEMDAMCREKERKQKMGYKEEELPESVSSSASSVSAANKYFHQYFKGKQVNTDNNESEVVDRKGKKIDKSGSNLYHSGPLLNPTGFGSDWGDGKKGFIAALKRSFKRSSRGPGETSSPFNHLSEKAKRISKELTAQRLDTIDDSEIQEWIDQIDHLTSSSYVKDDKRRKDATLALGDRTINYSGPLIAPGVNVEDVLKEHEERIQKALRKSFLEKSKTRKHSDQFPLK